MLANVVRSKHVARERGLGRLLQCRTFTSSTPFLYARPRQIILEGTHTNVNTKEPDPPSKLPYYFETGYSIFAKRPSRPFPPPFVSAPSGSFSDPLTTHDRANFRHPSVDGQFLKGTTNGDDAILISHGNFLVVNDGVGAWAQKERGHAALWSRLIAHYWALEVEKVFTAAADNDPDLDNLKPIEYLQTAYEKTKEATTTSTSEILGTTTATSALLHRNSKNEPIVLVTQLGDCAILIVRPTIPPKTSASKDKDSESSSSSSSKSFFSFGSDEDNADSEEAEAILASQLLFKTKEQWHWFDCPRQLGTNSPDVPDAIATTSVVPIQPSDLVLCLSDGVTDNLWDHEITSTVTTAYENWIKREKGTEDGVVYIARELMNAARVVAQDPYAESPYMERALDEGIAAEGGKLDDISVVVGICRKR